MILEKITDNNNPDTLKALSGSDIPELIAAFRSTHGWKTKDLQSVILLKSQENNVILTALHKGTEISSYHHDSTISFKILEGSLKFNSFRNAVTLNSGELLVLHGNIKYRLSARENTVFITTIDSNPFRSMVN